MGKEGGSAVGNKVGEGRGRREAGLLRIGMVREREGGRQGCLVHGGRWKGKVERMAVGYKVWWVRGTRTLECGEHRGEDVVIGCVLG